MEECITHFFLFDSVIWGIALFDTTVAFFEVMSDTVTLSCFVVVVVVVCVETRVGQQPADRGPDLAHIQCSHCGTYVVHGPMSTPQFLERSHLLSPLPFPSLHVCLLHLLPSPSSMILIKIIQVD